MPRPSLVLRNSCMYDPFIIKGSCTVLCGAKRVASFDCYFATALEASLHVTKNNLECMASTTAVSLKQGAGAYFLACCWQLFRLSLLVLPERHS